MSINHKLTDLNDFDYYPNLDSPGNDIKKVDYKLLNDDNSFNKENLKKISKEVLTTDNCIGFNLDGWLKSKIKNFYEWEHHPTDRKMGLFIKSTKIPKIFHIIVENKNEIEKYNDIWNNNILLHQEWEFRLYFPYQIKKLLNDKYPTKIEKFNSHENPLEYFKYLILYEEGGIYLKNGYKCNTSFNNLLFEEIIDENYIIVQKNSKLLIKYI